MSDAMMVHAAGYHRVAVKSLGASSRRPSEARSSFEKFYGPSRQPFMEIGTLSNAGTVPNIYTRNSRRYLQLIKIEVFDFPVSPGHFQLIRPNLAESATTCRSHPGDLSGGTSG